MHVIAIVAEHIISDLSTENITRNTYNVLQNILRCILNQICTHRYISVKCPALITLKKLHSLKTCCHSLKYRLTLRNKKIGS